MPANIKRQLRKKIPAKISGLVDMAYNLWWSWNSSAKTMFKMLDPPLWYKHKRNVVKVLYEIKFERLQAMANNGRFLSLYKKVYQDFQDELGGSHEDVWFVQNYPTYKEDFIAYLSMEYGIHASVEIYSGGLGILSGDHLKECSDLGIPLVAVGFLYQEGYFSQRIDEDGWQQADFGEADFDTIPILEVMDPKAPEKPLLVEVPFNGMNVHVKVWELRVGRIKLFLMDTNISENPPWERDHTDRLYGGSQSLRLKQEIILGIGAVRLLGRLGYKPRVWHLNEGHCAFSSVERIHQLMKEGQSFAEALDNVRAKTVFTTHTPVPAGHDVFPLETLAEMWSPTYLDMLGQENFYSLGVFKLGERDGYNMTVLGMRTAKRANAVSKLHQSVTEEMFTDLWAELLEKHGKDFQNLSYVTNGVHVPSFVSSIYQQIFEMADVDWIANHDNPTYWGTENPIMLGLSDAVIWAYHLSAKERLVRYCREVARRKIMDHAWTTEEAMVHGALLDPEALTIGFARRFTGYKRPNLIFNDFSRLVKILNNQYRPVQIVFAGKAHPADDWGKHMIQEIVRQAKDNLLGHRIIFLENYDLITAKMILAGVDVWLNNPIRPNEASGTSGMKAACNFVPNLSISDGWWAEGYTGENGWVINAENATAEKQEEQDRIDSESLYTLLELEIIPLYYDVDDNGVPVKWIRVMRKALSSVLPQFSSRRMLKDYTRKLYLPTIEGN